MTTRFVRAALGGALVLSLTAAGAACSDDSTTDTTVDLNPGSGSGVPGLTTGLGDDGNTTVAGAATSSMAPSTATSLNGTTSPTTSR